MNIWTSFLETVTGILNESGFAQFFIGEGYKNLIMIAVACGLLVLAIKFEFEPLLLLPIAFGMLLANLPGAGLYHPEFFDTANTAFWHDGHLLVGEVVKQGGLLDILYLGVKLGIYPPLIFLGIGCMTDFSPLISNPKGLLLGAAAQLGIFIAFIGALLLGMNENVAASIGIIGGADGPTAIFVTSKLAPQYLGPIAVAAYSYMALIPVIQPPIMKLLTTEKERKVRMDTLRQVSKTEKIIFPVAVTIIVTVFAKPLKTSL